MHKNTPTINGHPKSTPEIFVWLRHLQVATNVTFPGLNKIYTYMNTIEFLPETCLGCFLKSSAVTSAGVTR